MRNQTSRIDAIVMHRNMVGPAFALVMIFSLLHVGCGSQSDQPPIAPIASSSVSPTSSGATQMGATATTNQSDTQNGTLTNGTAANGSANAGSGKNSLNGNITPVTPIDVSGVQPSVSGTAGSATPAATGTTNAAGGGDQTWSQVCTIYQSICNDVVAVSNIINAGKTSTNTTTTVATI